VIWQALDNLGDSRTAAVGTIGNREWKRSAIRKIMFKNQSHLKNSNVSVISFSGLYGNNADFRGLTLTIQDLVIGRLTKQMFHTVRWLTPSLRIHGSRTLSL
jgi:hypothetical protein